MMETKADWSGFNKEWERKWKQKIKTILQLAIKRSTLLHVDNYFLSFALSPGLLQKPPTWSLCFHITIQSQKCSQIDWIKTNVHSHDSSTQNTPMASHLIQYKAEILTMANKTLHELQLSTIQHFSLHPSPLSSSTTHPLSHSTATTLAKYKF